MGGRHPCTVKIPVRARSGPCSASHELRWAAGIFDGEGSTAIDFDRRYGTRRIVMSMAQVHASPLRRFCRAVGVGAVRGPYDRNRPNQQPIHIWSVRAHDDVQRVVTLLWPYLSAPKRRQIIEANRNSRRISSE